MSIPVHGALLAGDGALPDGAAQGDGHGDVEEEQDGRGHEEEKHRGELVHRVALESDELLYVGRVNGTILTLKCEHRFLYYRAIYILLF